MFFLQLCPRNEHATTEYELTIVKPVTKASLRERLELCCCAGLQGPPVNDMTAHGARYECLFLLSLLFCCRCGGVFMFFAVVPGGAVIFCCRCGDAFIRLLSLQGRVYLFAVVPGGAFIVLLSSRGRVCLVAVVGGAHLVFAAVAGRVYFFCCRRGGPCSFLLSSRGACLFRRGGAVIFCCRCGDAFILLLSLQGRVYFRLLSSRGARLLFCCRRGGAFILLLSLRGRIWFFAVVAGTGVHLLTGFLGPCNDNKNETKHGFRQPTTSDMEDEPIPAISSQKGTLDKCSG